jgi:hypothetical protein
MAAKRNTKADRLPALFVLEGVWKEILAEYPSAGPPIVYKVHSASTDYTSGGQGTFIVVADTEPLQCADCMKKRIESDAMALMDFTNAEVHVAEMGRFQKDLVLHEYNFRLSSMMTIGEIKKIVMAELKFPPYRQTLKCRGVTFDDDDKTLREYQFSIKRRLDLHILDDNDFSADADLEKAIQESLKASQDIPGKEGESDMEKAIKASLREASFSGTALYGAPIKSSPKSAEITPRPDASVPSPLNQKKEIEEGAVVAVEGDPMELTATNVMLVVAEDADDDPNCFACKHCTFLNENNSSPKKTCTICDQDNA